MARVSPSGRSFSGVVLWCAVFPAVLGGQVRSTRQKLRVGSWGSSTEISRTCVLGNFWPLKGFYCLKY